MWRVIHSIGRGLRSVRPSQCCPQDCSEECSSKYHTTHYHHHEVSKVQAATLRHHLTSSSWSPLTIRRNLDFLGVTSSVTQTVWASYSSFQKVYEEIHTGSGDSDNGSSKKKYNATPYPRCPPWHWLIFQDIQSIEKCHSEKAEEREKKQNTSTWEKTCYSHEWKEVLQSSPTLHALGWGSAAALTWSLYHGWIEHHPCIYQKKNEPQSSDGAHTKSNSDKNKEVIQQDHNAMWNFHKPFKDFIPFEKDFSKSADVKKYYKNDLVEIFEISDVQCNFKNRVPYKVDLETLHESQTQAAIIPVYSYQQQFLDVTRNVCNTQDENHKIEEFQLHDGNESSISHQDYFFNEQEAIDSGCNSDSNQSSQSQTCTSKQGIDHNQFKQNEESSNVINKVSIISPENPTTEFYESEVQFEEEIDICEHYEATSQDDSPNNSYDKKIKILQDKLFEIVKAHHEERFSEMLKNQNTLLNTKPEEMIVYFQAGVLAGDINSAFNLALCYHIGHGIMQDFEKARKLYETSSAAGHGWATYNLAVLLTQGLGGSSCPLKAHNLLLQAADLGIEEAQEVLSMLEEEQQQTTPLEEEDKPSLRMCYSESCLLSAPHKEWFSSYSTGDLQSLLDEDDWNTGDFSIVANV